MPIRKSEIELDAKSELITLHAPLCLEQCMALVDEELVKGSREKWYKTALMTCLKEIFLLV